MSTAGGQIMTATAEAIADAIAHSKAAIPLPLEGRALASMSCGKTLYLVVMIGSEALDSDKFLDVALNWQPYILKAEFLAVQAPHDGKWFDVHETDAAQRQAQIRSAAAILDGFLDDIIAKRRVQPSNIALIGFGEGACLALEVGLRRQEPPQAIIAFSGAFEGTETLGGTISAKPPVLLVHGDADTTIPYSLLAKTKELLKAADVPVKSMTRKGIGHAFDDDAVLAAGDYLTKILVKPKDDHDDHDHDHHDDHEHDHNDHDHHDHGHDH
jgi:phospholipase/carboxylesterase